MKYRMHIYEVVVADWIRSMVHSSAFSWKYEYLWPRVLMHLINSESGAFIQLLFGANAQNSSKSELGIRRGRQWTGASKV